MYKRLLFITASILISLNTGFSQINQKNTLKCKNKKDEFSIVFIQDCKNFKQKAINSAAKHANKKGYKSFDITQEKTVDVILGKTDWPSGYNFYQNLYQEEIIEKEYNQERLISKSKLDYEFQKAYKIQIKCYNNTQGIYNTNKPMKNS